MKMKLLYSFLFCAQSLFAMELKADVVVISNAAHPMQLSLEEIREVFLGTRTIVNNWHVNLVDQESSSPVYEEFYRKALGKDATEMNIYWSEQIFSGKARPPVVVKSDADVIEDVIENPDAVGYVSASTDLSKVHVVYRLEKHPK